MANAKRLTVGGLAFPSTTSSGFSNKDLDQATDQLEVIFQAEEAMTITRLGIRYGSTTGTSPTYKISLQGVDGSGNPDGTIKGGGSPASKEFSPSGLGWSSNSWQWITLDNSYTCARGEFLALVVAHASGTVDGSNKSSFAGTLNYTTIGRFPCAIHNDNGTRDRLELGVPVFGYGTGSAAHGMPCSTFAGVIYDQGTAGADEYAVKFALPAAWGDTFKIKGVRFSGYLYAGGSTKIQLYDGGGASDTTVLQSVTFDHENTSNPIAYGIYEVLFTDATLATLDFGSTYRIGFQPQNTNDLGLPILDVANAADWDAYPGGQDFSLSTRVNLGSWTDTATRRMFVELLLDDWSAPAGGGGGGIGISRGRIFLGG